MASARMALASSLREDMKPLLKIELAMVEKGAPMPHRRLGIGDGFVDRRPRGTRGLYGDF
jgi:hypothetical protein